MTKHDNNNQCQAKKKDDLSYASNFLPSLAHNSGRFLIDSMVEGLYQYKLCSTKIMAYFYPDPTQIEPEIWNGFYSVPNTPSKLKIDFIENRFSALKKPLADAFFDYYKILVTKEKKPVIIPSQKQLLNFMLKTDLVYELYYTEDSDKVVLDLGNIGYLNTFHGVFNIVKAEFSKKYLTQDKIGKDADGVVLYSKYGDIYNPGDQLYHLAKLDFLNTAAVHYLSIDHVPIHVDFVDAICAMHYNLKEESVLYKLLAPHTRFTLAINDLLLRDPISPIQNSSNWWNKYTNPLPSIATTGNEFINVSKVSTNIVYNEDINQRKFSCTLKLDTNIPYLKTLDEYYQVIYNFVENIVKADEIISNSDYSLQKQMDDFVNSLSKYMHFMATDQNCLDSINVISRFIWQVSVAHSVNHCAAYAAFQGLQPDCAFQATITPQLYQSLITKDLRECNNSTSPEQIVDSNYAERTKNFNNVFTRFNHNPDLDLTMENIKYDFDSEFQDIVSKFQQDLIGVAESNPNFCPLHEIAQSIAF